VSNGYQQALCVRIKQPEREADYSHPLLTNISQTVAFGYAQAQLCIQSAFATSVCGGLLQISDLNGTVST
jgi:hypothetical protein